MMRDKNFGQMQLCQLAAPHCKCVPCSRQKLVHRGRSRPERIHINATSGELGKGSALARPYHPTYRSFYMAAIVIRLIEELIDVFNFSSSISK